MRYVNPSLQLINAAKLDPCATGDGPLSFNLSDRCLACHHQRCSTLHIAEIHESHSASKTQEVSGHLALPVSDNEISRALEPTALCKTSTYPVNGPHDYYSAHAIDYSNSVTTCDPKSVFNDPHVPFQPAVCHSANTDAYRIAQPAYRSQYDPRTSRNSVDSKRQHRANHQKRLSVPSINRVPDDPCEARKSEAEHHTHQYRLASLVNDCIYACPFFKKNPNDPRLSKSCRHPFTLSRLR